MQSIFEELGFLDAVVSSIQCRGSDVAVMFSESESSVFQLQFSGVVALQYHVLSPIADWSLSDESREIDRARDFLTRAGMVAPVEADRPLTQLTLLDERNLPMFLIVFRDCRLIADG